MKESELGQRIARELRARKVQCVKLHGNEFQRGLPDFVFWANLVNMFELKVASDSDAALGKLSKLQKSVICSLARTDDGAILVYAYAAKHRGGVAVLRLNDELKLFVENDTVFTGNMVLIVRGIAERLTEFVQLDP